MASPQTKNGFTKISNEILDALARIRIPGEARQVLDVIIRQTYGWNKKEAEISLKEFQDRTDLKKTTACKALAKLRLLNIITQKGNASENNIITQKGNASLVTYGLQKDFEKWKPLPKKVTLPKKVMIPLPKKVTPLIYKELKKKERKKYIYTGKEGFELALKDELFRKALEKAYGGLDINQTIKEMELWLTRKEWRNPNTKRHYTDFKRFISGWLKRELEKNPPRPNSSSGETEETIFGADGLPLKTLPILSTRKSGQQMFKEGLL